MMDRSVLIVEDDPATCVLWTKHLQHAGWQVQIVEDAEQAEAILRQQLPSVVILDVMLASQTSGWDLLAKLRSAPATQHLPVFVVSTLDEPHRAREAGATGYLVKPCSPALLVSRINQAVGAEAYTPDLDNGK